MQTTAVSIHHFFFNFHVSRMPHVGLVPGTGVRCAKDCDNEAGTRFEHSENPLTQGKAEETLAIQLNCAQTTRGHCQSS